MNTLFGMDMSNAFGKIEKGKCRIAMNGQIAIQTSNGYKTFQTDTGRLTNCSNFVSSLGDDFFYAVPASKVKRGDIVLIGGIPRCVIKSEKNLLTVMTYETGSVEHIVPERQMFMGNCYFYTKITCPMAGIFGKGKGKMNCMIRMMMLSDMMKSGGSRTIGDAGSGDGMNFMQLMMMQGMMKEMNGAFDNMFDDFDDEDDAEEDNEDMTVDLGGFFEAEE